MGLAGIILAGANLPRLGALVDRLEDINERKRDDKARVRTEAGEKFGGVIRGSSDVRSEIEKQLAANPRLADDLVKLATDNPEYVSKNMEKLAANPASIKQIVADGLLPPAAAPQAVPVSAPPLAPDLKHMVKEADGIPNTDSEIASRTSQLGGATIADVLTRAGEKNSDPASLRAIEGIKQEVGRNPDFAQKINLLMGMNEGLDVMVTDIIRNRPQLLERALPFIKSDPYKLKTLTDDPDGVQGQLDVREKAMAQRNKDAAPAPAASDAGVAGQINQPMAGKLIQVGTAADGQFRPGFERLLQQMADPANAELRAAFNVTGNDPGKFNNTMDRLLKVAEGTPGHPAVPGMFEHLSTFIDEHPAAAKKLLATVASGNAGGDMMIDKVVAVGRDAKGERRPGFGDFMDRVAAVGADGKTPKYPELNNAFAATGNDPKKFNNMMDSFTEILNGAPGKPAVPDLFERLNKMMDSKPQETAVMLKQVAAGDLDGAKKTFISAQISNDPSVPSSKPASAEQQNVEAKKISDILKVGLGVTSDSNLSDGIDGFAKRLAANPDLKKSFYETLLAKGTDGENSMDKLKGKLKEHPDLFDSLNEFMDRHPKDAKKMFEQFAKGNINGGIKTFESTTRMDFLADGIAFIAGFIGEMCGHPEWGDKVRAWTDKMIDKGGEKLGKLVDWGLEKVGLGGLLGNDKDKDNKGAKTEAAPKVENPAPTNPSGQQQVQAPPAAPGTVAAPVVPAPVAAAVPPAASAAPGPSVQDEPETEITPPVPDHSAEITASNRRGYQEDYDGGTSVAAISQPVESQVGVVRTFYQEKPPSAFGGHDPVKDGSLGSATTLDSGSTLKEKAWDPAMRANQSDNITSEPTVLAVDRARDPDVAMRRQPMGMNIA